MMNNMFSVFDPSTFYFSMNWLAMALPILFFHKKLYMKSYRFMSFINFLQKFMIKDMKANISKNFKSLLYFIPIFMIIYISNFMSLFPFIFAPNSHLNVMLTISLTFWLTIMFKGWMSSPDHMLIHLCPKNTPMPLAPFMVMIETLSNLIRPITLAVRMAANMIAGHILINLVSMLLYSNIMIFLSASSILMMLMILEFSVAIIQSYVLVTLMSLYLMEV
uniref:ATP synthase subunit a n=1 Tax=Amblyseius obtuserellus TaxID=3061186 RepID=A0AAU6PCK6_9ACAR